MNMDKWIEKYDCDLDILNLIYYLKETQSYTDDEIVVAIEKLKDISPKIGLSLSEILNIMLPNKIIELQ